MSSVGRTNAHAGVEARCCERVGLLLLESRVGDLLLGKKMVHFSVLVLYRQNGVLYKM